MIRFSRARARAAILLVAVGLMTMFCGDRAEVAAPAPAVAEKVAAPQPVANPWFTNEASQRGLNFQHVDGRSGRRYYVETAASGGGFVDFDRDGDLDIYLLNGAATPGFETTTTPRNAFFENRDGQFVDITERSGLGDPGYAMGMCVGDVDGDGWLDVFITNYGADKLYRNKGDGSFEDWTATAGVGGTRWGTSCAFGDLDGDGDLDLYVTNYVDFTFENNPTCGDEVRGINAYCRPSVFGGQEDYLYINDGKGRFREESNARGIVQDRDGKGFGVILADMDQDSDLDILVANDGMMNRYFRNNGSGYFEDISLQSGLGFNAAGLAESGMGLSLDDIDGDGQFDLTVTNYSYETNTLYLQRSGGVWEDATVAAGLAGPSYLPVGWGIVTFDVDNDGDLDMAVANGHVMDNIALFEPNLSYAQANLLLLNQGQARFKDFSSQGGEAFLNKKVSRGLAWGDVNNDGRIDLLVTNTNGTPDLLLNQHPDAGAWLGLRLIGPEANRAAIGARVHLLDQANTLLGLREVRSGGSFLTQNDLRLHFGLGSHQGPVMAETHWPDGTVSRQQITDRNQYVDLVYASNE